MYRVGEKIKAARIKRGLSMRELGKKLNPPVTQPTVSDWESGKKMPKLMNYLQLQKIIGPLMEDNDE
jgi:transcriptional regulator with XRE-family HTH domain